MNISVTHEGSGHHRSPVVDSSSAKKDDRYGVTSTVTIRVTPKEDHLVSWGILWCGFLLASIVAAWQVWKEYKMLKARREADVEQAAEGVSSADITRSMFRRLLLLAMVLRLALMPAQIWSDPLWWQFFGDTLPEMVFASAWTLLVSFFVQLVGIATGTGTNTTPSIVIQATAYVVYFVLITTQIWNSVASVLLYALLCCIYAALFGTVLFFCPRLLTLLQPSFVRHSGLWARLSICTLVCLLVFSAHTVGFARRVVAPPKRVYWWWNYGALELIPAIIFLIIMHPSSNKVDRNPSEADDSSKGKQGGIRRVESGSSTPGSSSSKRAQETTSLLKGSAGYGTGADSRATPPPAST